MHHHVEFQLRHMLMRLDIINQKTVSWHERNCLSERWLKVIWLHQDFTTLRCKIVMQEEGEIPRGGEKVIVHNTCVTPKSMLLLL